MGKPGNPHHQEMKKTASPSSHSSALNPTGANWYQNIWVVPAMLLAIGMGAYFTALDNAFTNWDDQGYVYENPLVTNFDFSQIKEIFGTLNIAGNYHPLTILSLGINHYFLGPEPFGFILVNILLHILNAWLIFRIVLLLRLPILSAWGAALLFLLHPLHVESVAWISERKDVLYTLFWLLSWMYYIRWRSAPKSSPALYLLGLVFFLLSCLSKGMAITLTGVIVLTDIMLNQSKTDWKNPMNWLHYLPWIGISVVFGVVAIMAQKAQGTIIEKSAYNAIESILLVCYGYTFYLIRMVLPWGLAAFYPYPADAGKVFPAEVYIAPIIIALLTGTYFYLKRKPEWQNAARLYAYSLLFYTGCILIVLQILPVGVAITADRYFYVSSIGWCIGFGALLQYLNDRMKAQAALSIMALLILAWGGLTARQANTWQDSITLFQNVITYHPRAAVGYNNIGTILGLERKDKIAIWYYRKALEYNPRYSEAWNNMGILYKDLGNLDSALFCATRALELYPRYQNALSNLGNIYFTMQQYDKAVEYFSRASEINPNDAGVYLNIGAALQMKGDQDGAGQAYLKALSINPNDFRAMHNLGDACFTKKDYDGAERYYSQVLQVKPDDSEAKRKLGLVADYRSGKIQDILTSYMDQIKSRPDDAKAWLNAGTEYFSRGKYKEAISYFDNALKRDPNLPEAWNNLGTAKGITGDARGALQCFQKALGVKKDYAEPMYNMGLAYGQLGENSNAVNWYQRAARLGHAGAQKVLKDNGYSW